MSENASCACICGAENTRDSGCFSRGRYPHSPDSYAATSARTAAAASDVSSSAGGLTTGSCATVASAAACRCQRPNGAPHGCSAAANAGDGGVASAELRAENETLREELAAAQKAHAAVAEAMRQSDAVEELRRCVALAVCGFASSGGTSSCGERSARRR